MTSASAWLPWVVLTVERLMVPGSSTNQSLSQVTRRLVELAFTQTMLLLSGHAQLAWYILVFAFAWGVYRGAVRAGIRRAWFAVAAFAGAGLLACAVASIQLALETMALRRLSPEQTHSFLSMMLDDTERLTTLIDRILGAARLEKKRARSQKSPVSMRHFVEEVLDQDRHLFEKDGHRIVLESGGDARVAIDRESMRMVLGNLIDNAARYSPRDSTIRLRLHRDLRHCRLDVSDNGIGIARRDLNNIFKIFWRGGGTNTAGTGLGLYIVRHIVKDHKGKVWASSQGPGRGSIFSVSLPRVRPYWGVSTRRSLRSFQQHH